MTSWKVSWTMKFHWHLVKVKGDPNLRAALTSIWVWTHIKGTTSFRSKQVMANEIADPVVVLVEEKLRSLSRTPCEFSIFIVPDQLRKINEKAYEPEILAIGPYHRGKDHLKDMEQDKIRYLRKLLQRTGESKLSSYVTTMRTLEKRARGCYKESVSLESDEFVEMMLLDGCFIVELIHKCIMPELREDDDPIFRLDWMLLYIARDVFLLENQLPFFVLWELFNMTTEIPDRTNTPFKMILYFFNGLFQGKISTEVVEFPIDQIKHLVEFVHNILLSSPPARMGAYRSDWKFIGCAREIQEAGIKFLKVEGGSLFDIKFDYGVMRIPVLSIGDSTESVFRNLIAYEQFTPTDAGSPNLVIDYIVFMDCLINTPEDAELLRRHGIIDNWLGDDEVIAKLINSLGDAVVIGEYFYYSEVFNEVNLHCSRRCNKWKAKLRHDYFNTPWAFISIHLPANSVYSSFLFLIMPKTDPLNPEYCFQFMFTAFFLCFHIDITVNCTGNHNMLLHCIARYNTQMIPNFIYSHTSHQKPTKTIGREHNNNHLNQCKFNSIKSKYVTTVSINAICNIRSVR
ncbi:hypothetical protein LWI29_010259 [Acer saccharum]|uniref:Uncharacterized protein n=1 Tax=Acer saccharum TaxID=4024 RepID=A0AA39TBD6_ACESA|nr:hypothetical protein LWI29_010259 [Acer saccharum]